MYSISVIHFCLPHLFSMKWLSLPLNFTTRKYHRSEPFPGDSAIAQTSTHPHQEYTSHFTNLQLIYQFLQSLQNPSSLCSSNGAVELLKLGRAYCLFFKLAPTGFVYVCLRKAYNFWTLLMRSGLLRKYRIIDKCENSRFELIQRSSGNFIK